MGNDNQSDFFGVTDNPTLAGDLAGIRAAIASISNPHDRTIAETAFLLGSLASTLLSSQKIVVLIHGIRTHAEWQERLKTQLEATGIKGIPIGYGFFDLFRFLCPLFTRAKPQRRVERELRSIRSKYPNAEISVVAHSFGTYLMSQILEDATDIRIHRLLLCGSVIPRDYRWDKVKSRVTGTVLNEAGAKDIWPALARVTWGFGPSGTLGFKTAHVDDRFHNCGHSDFFQEQHMTKYWLPFLSDGQIVPLANGGHPKSPWYISLPCTLPLKIGFVAFVVMSLAAFFFLR